MVLVSYSGREINAKLVYYGPGLSGKTTNLEYIYGSIPQGQRGKMVSMKTKTERTLFFDFLPVNLGELSGFKTRFLLYTVPGQVYYNATRKLVLKGVDAVVFVADSKRGKMDENVESLENLRQNLKEHGLELDSIPWVLQYNKRDLSDVYTIDELEEVLNPGKVPVFEAVATTGQGVVDTFKGVSRLLLRKLSKDIGAPVAVPTQHSAADAAAGVAVRRPVPGTVQALPEVQAQESPAPRTSAPVSLHVPPLVIPAAPPRPRPEPPLAQEPARARETPAIERPVPPLEESHLEQVRLEQERSLRKEPVREPQEPAPEPARPEAVPEQPVIHREGFDRSQASRPEADSGGAPGFREEPRVTSVGDRLRRWLSRSNGKDEAETPEAHPAPQATGGNSLPQEPVRDQQGPVWQEAEPELRVEVRRDPEKQDVAPFAPKAEDQHGETEQAIRQAEDPYEEPYEEQAQPLARQDAMEEPQESPDEPRFDEPYQEPVEPLAYQQEPVEPLARQEERQDPVPADGRDQQWSRECDDSRKRETLAAPAQPAARPERSRRAPRPREVLVPLEINPEDLETGIVLKLVIQMAQFQDDQGEGEVDAAA